MTRESHPSFPDKDKEQVLESNAEVMDTLAGLSASQRAARLLETLNIDTASVSVRALSSSNTETCLAAYKRVEPELTSAITQVLAARMNPEHAEAGSFPPLASSRPPARVQKRSLAPVYAAVGFALLLLFGKQALQSHSASDGVGAGTVTNKGSEGMARGELECQASRSPVELSATVPCPSDALIGAFGIVERRHWARAAFVVCGEGGCRVVARPNVKHSGEHILVSEVEFTFQNTGAPGRRDAFLVFSDVEVPARLLEAQFVPGEPSQPNRWPHDATSERVLSFAWTVP